MPAFEFQKEAWLMLNIFADNAMPNTHFGALTLLAARKEEVLLRQFPKVQF